ncbi:MAG: depolymerase [Vulcanimicrobiaceae bacterium]
MNAFSSALAALVATSFIASCSSGGASVGAGGGSGTPERVAVAPVAQSAMPTAPPADLPVTKLQRYRIDASKIFVSGISSGGFMAVQMHVAHSSVFKGAAVYAGGVYHCAQDSVELALLDCGGLTIAGTRTASYVSTLAQSEQYLDQQSTAGTIDPASHLAGQPVYLWSGTNDRVVNPLEMADLEREYRHYGANVRFDSTFPADHGWESPDGELACAAPAGSPYMLSCDQNGQPYDSVRTWLGMFFGKLAPRATSALEGRLVKFDQTEFGAGPSDSLDSAGYVYVPPACASGTTCGFVLALHGCDQAQSFIGTKFATESGIAEWADTNRIVVLYPYTVVANGPQPYNPKACFDWWGYSNDPSYTLKSGVQLSTIYKMVQRVTGAP